MRKTIFLALFLALPVATAQEPETVRALRYRILVAESALEMSHGGGQWIDELYFPDKGVVANVTSEMVTEAKEFSTRWRMHAFPSPIRNKFSETLGGEEKEHATTEVAVPRALAERIFELAELTRRQRELSLHAAEDARKAGVFGGSCLQR